MFNALEILYMVLAIILLPIGTLISMILWRIYRNMDRVDYILGFVERLVEYGTKLEAIPMQIIDKFLQK